MSYETVNPAERIEFYLYLQDTNAKFQSCVVDDERDKRGDLFTHYFSIYFTISEDAGGGGSGKD